MRVLIVGCGYVGLPLGTELVKQGHEVFGMRRSDTGSDELKAAGIQPVTADVTRPGDLAKLPGPFDWVVNAVSSAKGGVDEYREVYATSTKIEKRGFIFVGTTNRMDQLGDNTHRYGFDFGRRDKG